MITVVLPERVVCVPYLTRTPRTDRRQGHATAVRALPPCRLPPGRVNESQWTAASILVADYSSHRCVLIPAHPSPEVHPQMPRPYVQPRRGVPLVTARAERAVWGHRRPARRHLDAPGVGQHARVALPGKGAALPRLPPLRTVRTRFRVHGSSLPNAPSGTRRRARRRRGAVLLLLLRECRPEPLGYVLG